MNSSVQRYLEAATGLTMLTASKAEQLVKQMVRSGEAAGDQVGDLVEDLLARQRKNRDAVAALVRSETVRAVRAMGVATTSEVERLQKQVAALKREIARTGRADGPDGSPASGGESPMARKATTTTAAKTTAPSKKATAKKTAAKKTAAKKVTGKKATAKKTSKKATAKRVSKKATKKSTS